MHLKYPYLRHGKHLKCYGPELESKRKVWKETYTRCFKDPFDVIQVRKALKTMLKMCVVGGLLVIFWSRYWNSASEFWKTYIEVSSLGKFDSDVLYMFLRKICHLIVYYVCKRQKINVIWCGLRRPRTKYRGRSFPRKHMFCTVVSLGQVFLSIKKAQ